MPLPGRSPAVARAGAAALGSPAAGEGAAGLVVPVVPEAGSPPSPAGASGAAEPGPAPGPSRAGEPPTRSSIAPIIAMPATGQRPGNSPAPAGSPGVSGGRLQKRRNPGDDLFSRGAAPSVPSALESLTSVFGMGTGVASPPESPGFLTRDDVIDPRSAAHYRTRRHRKTPIAPQTTDHLGVATSPPPGGRSCPWVSCRKRSSPRPLVRLSFVGHPTSTCRLSNRWSTCGLTRLTRWGTSS